jgi:RimJ/RimL family protein N-acetyltransferase
MALLIESETPRLRLRQWRAADRAPFAALNADPQVMAFFPSMLKPAQSDALADRCEALIEARGWGFWAVEAKASGDFIGFVGLHTPSADLPCAPCVEIGWRLGARHWGQGLATEAAQEALRIGFDTLRLPEIVSFTTLGNHRSQAVMERLGMQAAGQFEHPHVTPETGLRAHVLYRLKSPRKNT